MYKKNSTHCVMCGKFLCVILQIKQIEKACSNVYYNGIMSSNYYYATNCPCHIANIIIMDIQWSIEGRGGGKQAPLSCKLKVDHKGVVTPRSQNVLEITDAMGKLYT